MEKDNQTQTGRIAPYIAAAIAHNPCAMNRLERFIRGRHGEMLAAGTKTGLAGHRIITMGRAEHTVSATLALGFMETDEENSDKLLRVFRAGWPEAMREAETKEQPSLYTVSECSVHRYRSDLPVMLELTVFVTACTLLGKGFISPQNGEHDRNVLSCLTEYLEAVERERTSGNGAKALLSGRSYPQKRRELFGTSSMLTTPAELTGLPPVLDYAQTVAGLDAEAYADGVILSTQEMDALTLAAKSPEDARIGAFVALMLKAARRDQKFIAEYDDELPRVRYEAAEQEARELRAQLSAAREELSSLRTQLDAAKAREQRRAQDSAAQAADLAELASLRDALFRLDAQAEKEKEGAESDTKWKATREIPPRLVSLGGLPVWRAEMARRIPSARFIPGDVTLPEDSIRSASELWIEPSYLGHSAFYRAVAVAKAAGVPVRYWPGRNVELCMQAVSQK